MTDKGARTDANAMSTLYFEDISVGDTFTSSARTITETDLTMFSMISGDWSAVHADAAYAETSRFGQRILHGPFGIALALGLFSRFSQFSASALALLDIRLWQFKAPILIGDTLHLDLRIAATRLTSSGTTGIVDREMRVSRHDGTCVQTGFMGLLMECRPK